MKKLMFAAACCALAGAASAVEVYDFKASVKHTYLKEKTIAKAIPALGLGADDYYVKYTKTSNLQGYLIQDDEGTLWTDGKAEITKADLQAKNRCFLVVVNKNAEKDFKFARILPASLEARWYNDQFKAGKNVQLPAEGYLYIGGEITSTLAGTTFDEKDGTPFGTAGYTARAFAGQWDRTKNTGAVKFGTVAKVGIDDFFFTSCYLFGMYNQPSWQGDLIEEFGDAWLNCAGLGKAVYSNSLKLCCGRVGGKAGTVLDNLSGNLKSGFFLCSENGEDQAHFLFPRKGVLEDQLWISDRLFDGVDHYKVAHVEELTTATPPVYGQVVTDVWADGNLDLRSTDVGYGTWSIKRNTSLKADDGKFTEKEVDYVKTTWTFTDPTTLNVYKKDLLKMIKSAMVKLDKDAVLFGDPIAEDAMINYSFYKNYLAQ